jgi:hypothetical protein
LKWQFRRHELYCQQVNVKLIVCTVHGTYKCRGHWNNAKSVTYFFRAFNCVLTDKTCVLMHTSFSTEHAS